MIRAASRTLASSILCIAIIAGGMSGFVPDPVGLGSVAQAAEPVYDPNGPEGTVYRLYRAYFLREPDADGFGYWLTQFNNGYPLTSISDDFSRSREFQSDYGDVSDRDFVTLVYNNVLERDPDQDGYDYWVGQMEAGMPRGNVMINFSDSAEFRSKTADGVPPGYRSLVVEKSGTGDTSFEIVFDRPTIVRSTHDGSGSFSVKALDENGEFTDLAANEIGRYSGEHLWDRWEDIRYVEINADGNWTVEFVPLSHAIAMDIANGNGSTDAVRAVSVPEARQIRLTHSGSGSFAVIARDANGEYLKLLANEIGSYDGTAVVPTGTAYLEITADGAWTTQA